MGRQEPENVTSASGWPRAIGAGFCLILAIGAILRIQNMLQESTKKPLATLPARFGPPPSKLETDLLTEYRTSFRWRDTQTDRIAQIVSQLGQKLELEAGLPRTGEFELVESDRYQSFSLPRRVTAVSGPLVDRLENEAQLAAVLAHELGHRAFLHPDARTLRADPTDRLKYVRTAPHSIREEIDADNYAMDLMVKLNFDPRQLIRAMERLRDPPAPGYFGVHGDVDLRVAQMESYLRAVFPKGVPDTLTVGRSLK